LTGTSLYLELEQFLAWFRVARVCQRELSILVTFGIRCLRHP